MLSSRSLFRVSARNFDSFKKVFFRNRKFTRRPVRVLTDDGQDYETAFGPKIDPIAEPQLSHSFTAKRKNKRSDEKATQSFKTSSTFDDSTKAPQPRLAGVPQYEKLGDNNSEYIKLMTDLKNRSKRKKLNLIALEGKRMISDGIDAGLRLKTVYFSIEENLVGIKKLQQVSDMGVPIKKVFYKDLKLFSDHVTSPGVVGIFEKPSTADISKIHSQRICQLPVTLVADNIRDPGNLGTIIRTAAATGIDKVICLKGCVDIWEAKVVRSSCGAHFRVPVITELEWPLLSNYIPTNSVQVYVADSNNTSQVPTTHNVDIITDTLNIHENVVDEDTGDTLKFDASFEDESILEKYKEIVIKTEDYLDVNYCKENEYVVIVVGGETIGPSIQSLKFCHDFGGFKIKIPLECGVDSLNTSVAASVLLYEIRRQFRNKMEKMKEKTAFS